MPLTRGLLGRRSRAGGYWSSVDSGAIGRVRRCADAQSLNAIRTCPRATDRSCMVGLMGCGKSAVGRRLAAKLGLPFVDADEEIEKAAGKSIKEIFADHGEAYFRDGERKVMARLLRSGPQVLATGGGAFMNAETRAAIARARHLDLAQGRAAAAGAPRGKRDNRPLLKTGDPEAVMQNLMDDALSGLCRRPTSRSKAATCRTTSSSPRSSSSSAQPLPSRSRPEERPMSAVCRQPQLAARCRAHRAGAARRAAPTTC